MSSRKTFDALIEANTTGWTPDDEIEGQRERYTDNTGTPVSPDELDPNAPYRHETWNTATGTFTREQYMPGLEPPESTMNVRFSDVGQVTADFEYADPYQPDLHQVIWKDGVVERWENGPVGLNQTPFERRLPNIGPSLDGSLGVAANLLFDDPQYPSTELLAENEAAV